MGNTVSLILPLPPSSNRYWRTVVDKKKGVAYTFVSDEAKVYKKAVKDMAGLDTLIYSQIAVTLKIFRAQRSGDLDNRIKILLDALQQVIYADDSQITELHAYRDDDKHHPRVEVEIKEIGGNGNLFPMYGKAFR